jgi:hypothetical protein
MKERFFVILGGQARQRNVPITQAPLRHDMGDSDADLLKRSPCLTCDLFERGTACSYADECSKIDAYQRAAAAHCTLFKSCDYRSMV